jgi:polysaccharide export outer membrane protein
MSRLQFVLPLLLLASAGPVIAQQQQAAPSPASDFVVRAGDVLHIRVWPDETLGGEFPVESTGHVHLPEVGEFLAAGLRLSELRTQLRERYALSMRQPVVSITPIYGVGVLGGVSAPGMYQVDPTMNALDVIIRAGGFTPRARRDDVRILRDGRTITYDAETALATGQTVPLMLQSGDRIVVPERRALSWQNAAAALQFVGTMYLLYDRIAN